MARVDYELRVKFKRHRQAFSWSTISPEIVPQVQQSFISSFFFSSPSFELAGWLAGWLAPSPVHSIRFLGRKIHTQRDNNQLVVVVVVVVVISLSK
jgi:hypothetical protein